jgi:hypothetical protein
MADFKTCPTCDRRWSTRQDFLDDPEVVLVGYQSFIQDAVLGLFLFNHTVCESTMSVHGGRFEDLQQGPIYALRTGRVPRSEGEVCLASEADADCPHECECGYVARVVQALKG